jgi:hypothetical protein
MLPWTLLFLSLAVIVFLIFYIRHLLKGIIYLSRNSSDLINAIESYKQHLGAVYELPMFYGDETLRGLLTHTRDLSEDLSILSDLFEIEDRREGVLDGQVEEEEKE